VSPLDPFITRIGIAYFSMEIAIRPEMHTYAGGLGVLAGDTARSCADLELPVVFVSLVSRAGYFSQQIDADGRQIEQPDPWDPEQWCMPLNAMVAVDIDGRAVWIRPWLYIHTCPIGSRIPILLLDTDLEQNSSADRSLTHHLYGGDEECRLKQEIVLGIGGTRLLRALGFEIHTYHLNEGHAALLTLELLSRRRLPPGHNGEGDRFDVARVRETCVFTTHTPVEAGHDRFAYSLFDRLLPGFIPHDTLKRLAGADGLNMTQLALNLSGYVNGVARSHAETTRHMFPGYRVHSVTNGVHAGTWAHHAFAQLYDVNFPQWQHEPEILVRALQLPEEDVWRCHQAAKADLVALSKDLTGASLDPDLPTLGFARRMTGYKRPMCGGTSYDASGSGYSGRRPCFELQHYPKPGRSAKRRGSGRRPAIPRPQSRSGAERSPSVKKRDMAVIPNRKPTCTRWRPRSRTPNNTPRRRRLPAPLSMRPDSLTGRNSPSGSGQWRPS
jgi:glycogen phosphorylase